MDLVITPTHFFGILAEYRIQLVHHHFTPEITPGYEGSLHLEVDIPSKPYSVLTLQVRDSKIVYNKILQWKLATHYHAPEKVLRLLKERCTEMDT